MYQKSNACTLEQITLNEYGMCANCIIPAIENLENLKICELDKLDEYESLYKKRLSGDYV